MPKILGLGNPLLDIQAPVDDKFLAKFKLKPNHAILAELPFHEPLFEEISSSQSIKYIAGGSAQNAIRAAQQLLKVPYSTAFFGCVGSDENAKIMKEVCSKAGVQPCYEVDDKTTTGTCAVCISEQGKSRSLVANLGAANNYKFEHLSNHKAFIDEFDIFYNEGYFVTVSPESIDYLAERATETGKIYATNTSAPFVVEVPQFRDVILRNLKHTDILFGNEEEFRALARSLPECSAIQIEAEDDQSMIEIARVIATSFKAKNTMKRHVIITRGHKSTILAVGNQISQVPVVKVENIVDCNGAGDAYAGGFLAALALGKSVIECCKQGAQLAAMVVQNTGCSFDD
jgi:adenosine kinase